MDITYKEFIDNILKTRGRFACGEEYHERHHIVPKCMGGTNDEENLIDLFAREHFESHRLLAIENPENKKLVYAWNRICNSRNGDYQITQEEYEEVRKAHRDAVSGENNFWYGKHLPKEIRKKLSESKSGEKHPNYGKNLSEKTKRKMSLAATGRGNPFYGKHLSKEHKNKISNAMKGENNHFYGKHHTEESKRKIGEAKKGINILEETKIKISLATKGENNPRAKSVQCIETGEVLWGAKAFQDKYRINKGSIALCCNGKRKTAGDYHWKYLYDQTRKDGTVIPGAITLGLITEEDALKMLEEQENTQGEN